jgi:hypothetical protein
LCPDLRGAPAAERVPDEEEEQRSGDGGDPGAEVEEASIGSPRSSAVARKPPSRAPAIPSRIVTMMPTDSAPGMIAFAISPARSPRTIQPTIPTG